MPGRAEGFQTPRPHETGAALVYPKVNESSWKRPVTVLPILVMKRVERSGVVNGAPLFLIVCRGNICRSPMAQGVFEHLARSRSAPVIVDSAGTSGWHEGGPPDPRAMITAARRGVDITGQSARTLRDEDFHRFDHILAVDRRNFAEVRRRAPDLRRARLGLLMEHVLGEELDILDPFYKGPDAFDAVYDKIERGVRAQLDHLLVMAR